LLFSYKIIEYLLLHNSIYSCLNNNKGFKGRGGFGNIMVNLELLLSKLVFIRGKNGKYSL